MNLFFRFNSAAPIVKYVILIIFFSFASPVFSGHFRNDLRSIWLLHHHIEGDAGIQVVPLQVHVNDPLLIGRVVAPWAMEFLVTAVLLLVNFHVCADLGRIVARVTA